MIRKMREFGITVAIGHHNADAVTIDNAIEAGAHLSTHLGNAAISPMDRHENVLWPQLVADQLYASIIADGFHLSTEELIVFYRAKGPERLILISDLTYLSGRPPGRYEWQKQTVEINDQGKVNVPGKGWLAGASQPLFQGISHMINTTGCSMAEAIDMASINPARLLVLDNIGQIEKGKKADIILFSYENQVLEIQKTIKSGRVVYERGVKC
jgi:N-acetylglucosamine-6-phosphate deacetylase